MHTRNLESLLLISLNNKELTKIKKLFQSLTVSGEYSEIRDCLIEHEDDDIFQIITDENEHLIVVLGTKKIHLILPKIGNFNHIRDKIVNLFENK